MAKRLNSNRTLFTGSRGGKHLHFMVVPLLAVLLASKGTADTQGPPPMPVFDKATVQKLLDHVEDGKNASILKIGYFRGHRRPPFPVADGYALLKEDIAQAKPESRRWFLLQSLRVWAAIRLDSSTRSEGLTTFEQLCCLVASAEHAGASDILQETISDFTDEIQMGNIRGVRVDHAIKEQAEGGLVKAFEAYWDGLKRGQDDNDTPDWGGAAKADDLQLHYSPDCHCSKEPGEAPKPRGVVELIEHDLQDPRFAHNYWMLKNAALFYGYSAPAHSLELLQRARPVVPSQNPAETHWLLSNLVDALESNQKLPEAIAVQKDAIKLTGRGQAKLVCLYAENFDKDDYNSALSALMAPTANEQEINEAIDLMLNSKPMQHSYGDTTNDAKNLLTSYLSVQRPRSVEQELLARIQLSDILVSRRKFADAKAALSLAGIQAPPADTEASALYEEAQRLEKQLDSKAASAS